MSISDSFASVFRPLFPAGMKAFPALLAFHAKIGAEKGIKEYLVRCFHSTFRSLSSHVLDSFLVLFSGLGQAPD